MVILTLLPRVSSNPTPHTTSTSVLSELMNSVSSRVSLILKLSSALGSKKMLNSSFFEPMMSRFLSRGELSASRMAVETRPSPSPYPVEIMAAPPSRRVVSTSLKSRLMSPLEVMISDIERAAIDRVSSALPNALRKSRSPYISLRRSLLMTSSASTYLAISSAPAIAFLILT